MADKWNFVWLASSLTLEERQELLKKFNTNSKLSKDPLYQENAKIFGNINIDAEYISLSWYSRFWFFVQGLFKHRSPKKVFLDHEVAELGKRIDKKFPGLFDSHSGLLLPVFYSQFSKLKEAAKFFYSALDVSVNKDRDSFFAFLGSLEMQSVHAKLLEDTDIAEIAGRYSGSPENEWKQIAIRAMEDNINQITKAEKQTMYTAARSLLCLKELSSFSFDRVIKVFGSNRGVKGFTCYATEVKDSLISLNNILFSLKTVPHLTLLESLFVFLLQKRAGEPGFYIDKEINSLLVRAEESLAIIREFNKQVPLTWMLRCLTREMTLSPMEISGGEDWLVFYRDYWRKQIDARYSEHLREFRQQGLTSSFHNFLKGRSITDFENIRSKSNPKGMPIRGSYALSFLYTFCSVVLKPEISRILYVVYIGAGFRREEDRVEFAEAYNFLTTMEEEIRKFEHRVSRSGDYGRRYAQVSSDAGAPQAMQNRMQTIIYEVQDDALNIIDRALGGAASMVKLLSGMLVKDGPNKKNILHNYSDLAARDSNFTADTAEVIQKFQTLLSLLEEIDNMESGR